MDEAVSGRVAIAGPGDRPGATAPPARATLPGLVGAAPPPASAAGCHHAVGRCFRWGCAATVPYDAGERTRLVECTRPAARTFDALAPGEGTPDRVMLSDPAGYSERDRATAERRAAAAPDRGPAS